MVDITGKSFIAMVQCRSAHGEGLVDYLRRDDVAGSGWLVQTDEPGQAMTLRFDYVGHTPLRMHYRISAHAAGLYSKASLGVSRNGYLGLYHVAGVIDYLKLEIVPSEGEPDCFEFFMRDRRGYRVKVSREDRSNFYFGFDRRGPNDVVNFLNVEKGEAAHFGAKIIQYL